MNDCCGQDAPCGCCDGVGRLTPVALYNRPGLSQISYRVGTHARFKASMLAALTDSRYAALGPLKSREDDDFSIALLDAWAVSADILTFYQERLANESYLRTAVEDRSVFELARLVGYQPSPGVSASASLAFTLNDAPGAPDPVTIPAATRVQSIPAQGQLPAMFETSADIVARIEHNALQPQTTLAIDFSQPTTLLWFSGTSTNLKPGDALLFVAEDRFTDPTSGAFALRTVTAVVPDAVNKRTLVRWDQTLQPPPGFEIEIEYIDIGGPFGIDWKIPVPILKWVVKAPFTASSKVHCYAQRRRVSLYGATAMDARLAPPAFQKSTIIANEEWKWIAQSQTIFLDAAYSGIVATTDAAQAALVDPAQYSWVALSAGMSEAIYRIDATSEVTPLPTRYTLSSKATRLSLDSDASLADVFIPATRVTSAFVQSELLDIPEQPILPAAGDYAWQDGTLAPVVGSQLSVVGGARLVAGQKLAVGGKRIRLQLVSGTAQFSPAFGSAVQGTVVPAVGDVFLVDAFPPTVQGWSVLTTKGVAGTFTAAAQNIMLLPADKSDPVVGELAVVDLVAPTGGLTALTFTAALRRIYDRATVSLNANVADATHGETVDEILGSGDSSIANQQFALKQSPLTYVGVAQGRGAQSTLEVWVNDLKWRQTDSFLATAPKDRAYVARAGDGGVTIQFGDGKAGARPPSAAMNVRAHYRKGLGLSGMVAPGQLSQAIDRPGGLKGVSNPEAASGGADPDTAADARTSVPIQIQTMGRVVSQDDYASYARAFAGIAKASVAWTWFGTTRGLVVTVAGPNGTVFEPDAKIVTGLAAALVAVGNPYVPVRVVPHRQLLFAVDAALRVDTESYDPKLVLAAARAALAGAFGFAARDIGQSVAQSAVVSVVQNTPGVIAVHLTGFALRGAPPQPGPLPTFLGTSATGGGIAADGLLLIDPLSLDGLEVWS